MYIALMLSQWGRGTATHKKLLCIYIYIIVAIHMLFTMEECRQIHIVSVNNLTSSHRVWANDFRKYVKSNPLGD